MKRVRATSAGRKGDRVPVWEPGKFRWHVPTALGAAAWLMFLEFLVDLSTRTSFVEEHMYSLGTDLVRLEVVLVPVVIGLGLGYALGVRGVVYGFVAAVLYLAEQHHFQGLWTREGTLWAAGYSYRDDAIALFGTVGATLCGALAVYIVSRAKGDTAAACAHQLSPLAVMLGGGTCALGGLWLSLVPVSEEMYALVGGSSYYSQGPVLLGFGGLAALAGLSSKLKKRAADVAYESAVGGAT